MIIKHINNQILKDNESLIEFQYPVVEFKLIENYIIVRLDASSDIVFNENLFCIDLNGTLIWQIEKTKHIYSDSPYTNIIYRNSNLFSYNQDGCLYTINIHSGKIIERSFIK